MDEDIKKIVIDKIHDMQGDGRTACMILEAIYNYAHIGMIDAKTRDELTCEVLYGEGIK